MGTRILGQLSHVSAGYRGRRVIDDISLSVTAGRQLAILGPSGAGKSTLLRVLTGEIQPIAGTLTFPAGRPRAALVTQQAWLFEWLTVRENIEAGLAFAANAPARGGNTDHWLALLELTGIQDSYPDQISGGQAQRASLARALAVDPDWLLLDEPFSALDPGIREQLQQWLRRTVVADRLTSIIVTHDIDEALILADEIVVLDGRGGIRRTFTNQHPAKDTVGAQIHPLRSPLRATFARDNWEPGDEEFSGPAHAGAHT